MSARAAHTKAPHVLQFKIVLQETSPEIWRRIQVPSTYTFWDLHVAIQDAMGWLDSHLHEFHVLNPKTELEERIGVPDEELQEEGPETLPSWECRVSDYLSKKNPSATYVYDLSDDWRHDIVFESVHDAVKGKKYPVCVAGARACPPEDSGGAAGYEDLLQKINDPEHEEHAESVEWVGASFDPEEFEPKKVQFDDPELRWRAAFEDAEDPFEDEELEDDPGKADPRVLRSALREVIETQLRDGDPPETKLTHDRLIAEGFPEAEVMRMLCAVVGTEMFEMLREKRDHDVVKYKKWLKALPKLPFD